MNKIVSPLREEFERLTEQWKREELVTAKSINEVDPTNYRKHLFLSDLVVLTEEAKRTKRSRDQGCKTTARRKPR